MSLETSSAGGTGTNVRSDLVPVEYFAYGSNMSEQVMTDKCPRHRFLGAAKLPGYRLAFTRRSIRTGTGVADVVEQDGGAVWGALYELNDDDLAVLDRKEGYGWAYTHLPVLVQLGDGSEHEAVAYTVIEKQAREVPPSPTYLEGVIRAARERGLPEEYIGLLESWRASLAG